MKPEPKSRERPTPEAKPRRKRFKRFGYSYRMVHFGLSQLWYETAAQRDQALASHNKRYGNFDWITRGKPIERSSDPTPNKHG
jgi:hypothetical protein